VEIAKLVVSLVLGLAWPIVALIVGFRLIAELKGGLVAKIVQPGGTIEYGGTKLTVAKIETVERELQAEAAVEGHTLVEPTYASTDASSDLSIDENLTPYEVVMTAWGELARAITDVASKYDGEDDLRKVWGNVETLRDKSVIVQAIFDQVRELQTARNSVRRTGDISRDAATSFARSAFALKQKFERLG
jgi:hypothetical protein